MTEPDRARQQWREALRRALSEPGLDADLDTLGEIFTAIGRSAVHPGLEAYGADYGLYEIAGRYLLNVTEQGWAGFYASRAELEADDMAAYSMPLEDCALEALLDAARRDLLTVGQYETLARYLGETVFEQDRDAPGPAVLVLRLGGTYVRPMGETDVLGPFDTLEEAVGPVIHVGPSTCTLTCTEWSTEMLLARLRLDAPPDTLTINGEEWPIERIRAAVADRRPPR